MKGKISAVFLILSISISSTKSAILTILPIYSLCKMFINGHLSHFRKSCHFTTNKVFLSYFFHKINLK